MGILLVPLAATADVTVALKSEAEISAGTVRLADIADVHADDSETARWLASRIVGAAPDVSREATLSALHLRRWLDRQSVGAWAPRAVRWSGSAAVRVRRAAQRVSGQSIEQIARICVEQWVRDMGGQIVSVRALGTTSDRTVRTGAIRIESRPVPSAHPRSRRVDAWVDVLVDGEAQYAVPVSFDIVAHRTVAVLARSVGQDEPMQLADFGTLLEDKRVDFERLPVGAATASEWRERLARLPSKLAWRRSLMGGSVIGGRDLVAAPDVRRGGEAILATGDRRVAVLRSVEVLQDGFVGQVVRARHSGKGLDFPVRVVSAGRVEAVR